MQECKNAIMRESTLVKQISFDRIIESSSEMDQRHLLMM